MSPSRHLALTIAVAATGFTIACSTKNPEPSPEQAAATAGAPAPAGWSEKMVSLSKTLSDLLPLVSSRTKFNAEKNQLRIEEDTKRLKTLAHSLQTGSAPNADPSMRIMTGLFAQDIERALESMKAGNREYARNILKDTTAYCIQCHTQTANGPDFPRLNLDINTTDLSALERAEFFAATRQFDRAIESYKEVVSSESLAKSDPFEWEHAARSALGIVVRVKKDPAATQELITQLEKNSALPVSIKKDIAKWKITVKEWAGTKQKTAQTPDAQLKQAEELIKRAQKRQEFPLDHSQDILYFRASSLLHDFLSAHGTNDEKGAKALYLAGIAAEATRDMNFWTLHETFYQMCIRSLPHTKQAEQCYDRMKESITLGYSGSGGVRIPPDVNRRLEALKAEASTGKK